MSDTEKRDAQHLGLCRRCGKTYVHGTVCGAEDHLPVSDTEKATGYTTETIREDLVQTSSWRFMQHKIGPEFDRWLAARDAEQREAGRLAALEEAEKAKADAWDEGYDRAERDHYGTGFWTKRLRSNPYPRSSSPEGSN